MALKTSLGREIINPGLVGENIVYRILKTPVKPAYPNGTEICYSDDYISKLNRMYSLNDMLGKNIEELFEGFKIYNYIMDSPLNNTEGEEILGRILYNSAQAKQWQPFIIDVSNLTDARDIPTAKEYLERVENISPTFNEGRVHAGVLFGLAVAKRGNFVLPFDYDNKVIAVPSQTLIEYFSKQK
jgi:hypothetical protein